MNAAAQRIDKLVVVGVGLIGGSFALAQKAAGGDRHHRRRRARAHQSRGSGESRHRRPVRPAGRRLDAPSSLTTDIVLLAAPVAQYPALFRAMAPHLGPHTIVTDAGSTKQDVIAAARATLGAALPRFVPAHPIAGTEQSGAAAAFSTLYAERNVVLTPLPETDPLALATVAAAWHTCGAQTRTLDAAAHDRIFAAVSHLPHVLAFALVDELAARPDAEELFRFAASGFRDFTRIAASSPEMWRDIALANRSALLVRDRRVSRAARSHRGAFDRRRRRRPRSASSPPRAPRAGPGMPAATPPADGVPDDGPREP